MQVVWKVTDKYETSAGLMIGLKSVLPDHTYKHNRYYCRMPLADESW